jgi:hypothetical protein
VSISLFHQTNKIKIKKVRLVVFFSFFPTLLFYFIFYNGRYIRLSIVDITQTRHIILQPTFFYMELIINQINH